MSTDKQNYPIEEGLVHSVDGGLLVFVFWGEYGYFSAPVYRCQICGLELDDANNYDVIKSIGG